MKIERLLTTTLMLLNRRKVTAKELSQEFGVTIRTVYRDIETLNASGIPVISWQGYEGGFCIADTWKMSRQLLTFDDMVTILRTLKGVNRSFKNRELTTAIEKITALIPEDKEELYQQRADSFVTDITPWGGSADFDTKLSEINHAVTDSFLISFAYTSASGIVTYRTVEPHTLVFKHFSWYLLAYCRERKAFRVFRLSRIGILTLSTERFVRRLVSPLDHFSQEADSRKRESILLRFAPSMRLRALEVFGEELCTEDEFGFTLVRFEIPIDEWTYSMVMGFGEQVEVVEPISLREEIFSKIEKMKNLYRNLT